MLSNSITIYSGPSGTSAALAGRNQGVHYVTNPVLRGFFRLDRGGNGGFLVVNLVGDTARPEIVAAYPEAPWANVAEGITKERALELLRAAIGVPGLPLVIKDIATWQAVADIAERYSDGRVLLAGDAVHVVPPNGGLAQHRRARRAQPRVEAGRRAERHRGPGPARDLRRGAAPGGRVHPRAVLRAVRRPGGALPRHRGAQPVVDDLYLELGYRYQSTAIIADPQDADVADGELAHRHPRDLRAQPGSRAPHVFLNRDGARCPRLTCSARTSSCWPGPRGAAWPEAAQAAAQRLGVGLDAYQVAGGDDEALGEGTSPATATASARPTRWHRTAPSWSARTASSPGAPRTAAAPRPRS